MAIYKDEIFGPVLGVTRVGTYDEAIKMVNSNRLFMTTSKISIPRLNGVKVCCMGLNPCATPPCTSRKRCAS